MHGSILNGDQVERGGAGITFPSHNAHQTMCVGARHGRQVEALACTRNAPTSAAQHHARSLAHAQRRQLAAADAEWRAGVAVALRVLAGDWVAYEGEMK
jgi:hypothetical protein